MTNSRITTAQAIAIVLSVFASHTIVSVIRDLLVTTRTATIINMIYVGIIAIFVTLLIVKLLKKFPGSDIIDISNYLGGPLFQKIIGGIFIAYFIFSSSILLRNFCECLKIVYYPMTNITFILLAFVIVLCFLYEFKFETVAKVNLLIVPIVLFSMAFIFLANINHFSFENMYPILGEGFFNTFVTGLGNLGAFGGISLLYFLPPLLKEPAKMKKISILSIGIAVVYLLLCVSTILFMFSFLIQVDEIMPLYSAARYIEFGSFFQRLESFLLLFWMIQLVCYLSLILYFAMHIFKKITHIKTTKPLVLPFALLVFAVSLFPKNYATSKVLESNVYPSLVIGIVFVLSLLLLLLANLKKRKKKVEIENE